MKKEIITTTIAIHPTQAKIARGLQNKKINLQQDSLRKIAEKIGLPKESPQKVKHHLEQLLKLGVIQKIYGEYVYKRV